MKREIIREFAIVRNTVYHNKYRDKILPNHHFYPYVSPFKDISNSFKHEVYDTIEVVTTTCCLLYPETEEWFF